MNKSEAVVTRITGRCIPLRGNDIDTDRIIPARYLKLLSWEELGRYAFYHERYDKAGNPKNHPLNDRRFRDHDILLVERNFGCGSSREHAPQSLMRWGIRAFIGISFAGIFSGNCTANGMPAVRADEQAVHTLIDMVEKNPEVSLVIDLESKKITAGSVQVDFDMPESDRKALVSGTWDTTATLLERVGEIEKKAASLPYIRDFPYPAVSP
jgi:3-isopropylmalate/(R)-2-methylmalate dehydratase small subunit